ncbi:hypothetical protein J6590_016127 [Homalodisca vitripennis]|nr:hypothetical protein J6590_016127 [Homalodisca vitripennis]
MLARKRPNRSSDFLVSQRNVPHPFLVLGLWSPLPCSRYDNMTHHYNTSLWELADNVMDHQTDMDEMDSRKELMDNIDQHRKMVDHTNNQQTVSSHHLRKRVNSYSYIHCMLLNIYLL